MSTSNEQKHGNWFSRHKVLTVIGAIIVVGIIGSALGGNQSNTQTVPNSNSSRTTAQETQPEKTQKEKLTIKNSAYSSSSGMGQVVGEITNNDNSVHSATLIATFYSADGKILGTAVGAINEVAPSDTKTFTLITTDNVAEHKDMKVQVDTLL